jgi:hypothetical protein
MDKLPSSPELYRFAFPRQLKSMGWVGTFFSGHVLPEFAPCKEAGRTPVRDIERRNGRESAVGGGLLRHQLVYATDEAHGRGRSLAKAGIAKVSTAGLPNVSTV